jgi:PAS domain S-box-containing protein
MTLTTETLLALLASPVSGTVFADVRPAYVLAGATLSPVLANAAGLKELGAATLADLGDAFACLPERLVARVASFAAEAEAGQRRSDMVRLPVGEGQRLERLELAHLGEIAGEALVLLVLASRAAPLPDDDSDGLAHLGGEDRFIVLFDEEGDAVASHGDETLLDDIHEEVEDLANEEDPAPVLLRRVHLKEGDREIGLVLLAGGPEQILYVLRLPKPDRKARLKVPPRRRIASKTTKTEASVAPEPEAPKAEAAEIAPVPVEPAVLTLASDEIALAPTDTLAGDGPLEDLAEDQAGNPETAVAADASAVADSAPTVEADDIGASLAADAATVDAQSVPSEEIVARLDTDEDDGAEVAAEAPNAGQAEAAPVLLPPLKFVWQMDAQRRFLMVSPELASVVGEAAAPRVGESWADLASRLTVDIDGRVAHALSGVDTWSGLTVLWPVAGVARRVPVDLAAMPMLGAKRAFEGFRGFGTVRPAETLDDVTATGLRLMPAEVVAEEIEPEEPEAEEVAAPVVPVPPRADARVVTLAAVSRDATHEAPRLTAPERNAFRQIAQALGVRIEGDDFVPVQEPQQRPSRAARVKAEPARQPTEAMLLDRLPEAAVVAGDDDLVHVNPAFLALTGYEDLEDFEAEGGLEALFAGRHALREAVRAGDSRPVPALTKTGAVVPVRAKLTTITWSGEPAVLLTLEPIEETPVVADKAADVVEPEPVTAPEPPAPTPAPTIVEVVPPAMQAELGDARARIAELETILDTATDGVLILTADGMVVTANRAAEALFGLERAEMTDAPLTQLLAPESRRSALDYLDGLSSNGVASVLNDGREVIGEVHPDGLIPLFMTVGRIGAGDQAKFCAVLRDITQWKKSEEELTFARRRAEEASLHKSDFLAKISHEIRTPLNAIIGFSEVMLDERFGTIGNERYRDYLRDIHSSGTHIMSLVNDLLDLSKVEAGKMDLKFEAVPLGDLIAESVAIMQPQANRERIIIRTSLPGTVPAVVADARSVRQIVLNLLSNAIKFTPAGGQVIVSIALEETGEVMMRVRDTGHGMTDKEIQTALEPFRQLHTTRTSHAGTGLGLPLTKALTEANRAAFTIDSTPGQGTLVTITFPVNRVLA